jgi:heterodisulfide reductase subunit C
MPNLFEQLRKDVRFIEGLKACINCGTCTAICPAAQFYDYDPRQIADTVQKGNEAEIEQLLKSDTIWFCGECLSCKTRCPRGNTPGYIIQALRNLAQQNGFFAFSEKGRQQLKVKRIVGDSMLKYGYCVYVDEISTIEHPEQGPVWDWFRQNTETILQKLGANYKGNGAGTLRKISEADLNELRKIFIETGAIERFETIEKQCNDTGR